MKEEWKDIKGFEGYYQVSNLGQVRSVERYKNNHKKLQLVKSCVLKTFEHQKGYLVVKLCKNNIKTHKRLHRLVAEAFIPNPKNKPQVNHIDGNKKNNIVSNLEWCNGSYNILHAYKTGLIHSKPVIDKKTGIIYNSIREASIKNNKLESSISHSCRFAKKSRWSFV